MRSAILVFFLTYLFGGSSQNCNNIGFESSSPGSYTSATGVAGWTVSSQYTTSCENTAWQAGSSEFSLVATPISGFAGSGFLQHSPLGGTLIAVLNNSTADGSGTRLVRTVSVTSSNQHLNYAFAFIIDGVDHNDCCSNPRIEVLIRSPQGSYDHCLSRTITSVSGCNATNTYTSLTSTLAYSKWQLGNLNLAAYTGSTVTLEVISRDCEFSGHYAQLYFDAECSSTAVPVSMTALDNSVRVNWCAGTGTAIITAPPGMSTYTWTSPTGTIPISQASLSALTIASPSAGQVYTLAMTSTAGCISVKAYTLVYTVVGAGTHLSSMSCGTTATGGATLYPTGSGVGYNVTWYNSTSSAVATGTALSNLLPGSYNVHITAAVGCGSASASVFIPAFSISPVLSTTLLSGCSGDSLHASVYLSGPSAAYSFSWSPSTFLGLTNSSFITLVPSVAPASSISLLYSVAVTSTVMPGCTESRTLMLVAGNPQVVIQSPGSICQNAGLQSLTASPQGGTFYSFGIGTGISGDTLNPSLIPPGVYSLNYSVTETGCTRYAGAPFTILTTPTLIVSGPDTLCAGSTAILSVTGGDVYFWPGIGQGSVVSVVPASNTVYTVSGNHSSSGCVDTKTFFVAVAAVPTVMVSAPDSVCFGETVVLSASGADSYSWSAQNQTSYSISLAPGVGVNAYTVTGVNSQGNCTSSSQAIIIGVPVPTVIIGGPVLLCEGEPFALIAAGANNFLWHNQTAGNTFSGTASPGVYSVTGTNDGLCYSTASLVMTVEECTGITSIGDRDYVIYPNPSSGMVTCDGCAGEILYVSDFQGNQVFLRKIEDEKEAFNISFLPRGIYFFRVGTTGTAMKIVRQ